MCGGQCARHVECVLCKSATCRRGPSLVHSFVRSLFLSLCSLNVTHNSGADASTAVSSNSVAAAAAAARARPQ